MKTSNSVPEAGCTIPLVLGSISINQENNSTVESELENILLDISIFTMIHF